MNKYALCLVLLFAVSSSATISYVQSSNNWSGGTTSCAVGLTTTSVNDLLVVWGEWQTPTGMQNNITASISGLNAYMSAVGPTVQAAATNPTAAQMFYAKKITSTSETVTLTFSAAVSSSACVIVEFTGVDINNPLDTASAGYSLSGTPTGLLDSGNVAPANSNLLVFGGGISDNGTATTGTGFTLAQRNAGSVTEYAIVSANTTLQRATGALTPSFTTGNWLMQMAVFRDASWTVTGAWNPARPAGVRYADQFPGITADAKITNAMADLPATGGIIDATALQGSQNFSATVVVNAGVTVLLGATTVSTAVCPAFRLQWEGSTVQGMQMGTGTGAQSPSVIKALTGCSGPMMDFNLQDGPRGGRIKDLKIDGNNVSGVSTGILVENGQNLMNEVDHVTVANVASCVKLGGGDQDFRITRMSCDNSQFTGTEVAALDFGSSNNRFITVDGQSRFICKSRCFVVGTDDNHPANTSRVINFIDDDFEVVTSSAQTNGTIGLVRNVIGFKMLSGWVETETGANSTTMIQLGTSNSNPYPYSPRVEQVGFNGNGLATWGVDLSSTVKPVIRDNSCLSAMNMRLVKNSFGATGGVSAAIIEGNQNCSNASGKDVDSFTGIVDYDGDSFLGNDYKVFANGWSFGGTIPVTGFQGTGNLVVTNMGSTITSPTLSGAVTASNVRLALSDMGQCTMTSGICPAQPLASVYASAPRCWTQYVSGTLTGLASAPATVAAVTPQSSVSTDNAVVRWSCFGN